MSGIFSTFNIATRGMAAQQKAIDVTSHNIANANTEGYSRQRATMETTTPFGMPSLNNSAEPGQLGTGVQISAIERFRDAFLDYQTRAETSTKGQYDARQTVLGEVESIFNEPSDTGLATEVGKFFDSWQQLAKQPSSSDTRTVVAQQSSALADDLNQLYKKLTDLKGNVQDQIRNSLTDFNSALNQIDQLNTQIVGVTLAGNHANDLMDKRDLLLDKLSSSFNITVENKQFSGIDIRPADNNINVTDPYIVKAQSPGNSNKFSYIQAIQPPTYSAGVSTYTITYNKLGDQSNSSNTATITVQGINNAADFKTLDEGRVLWANNSGDPIDSSGNVLNGTVNFSQLSTFQPSNGELKGYQSVEKDLDDYINQLNSLAKALAFSVNAIHSGATDPTATLNPAGYDTTPFFVNSDAATYNAANQLQFTASTAAGPDVLVAEQNITAGNISFNKELFNNPMEIKTRTNDYKYDQEAQNTVDGESDGARALSIASLRNGLMTIQNVGTSVNSRKDLFDPTKGANQLDAVNNMTFVNNTSGMSMDTYYKDSIDRIGIQSQEAQRMVKNQDALLNNFEQSRASVSGVSLDEEMANLVQFQHAYTANAKVISTIDQLLDVVVNGLKR